MGALKKATMAKARRRCRTTGHHRRLAAGVRQVVAHVARIVRGDLLHKLGRTQEASAEFTRAPDSSGQPLFQAGGFTTDHRSPMKERWGGWYVTGTHGSQLHMGNTFVEKPAAEPAYLDMASGANITDLSRRFDTDVGKRQMP